MMDRSEPTLTTPRRTYSPAPSRTSSPIPARSFRPTPNPLASHINSSRLGLSKSPSSNRLSAGSWTTTQKSIKYGRGKHSDVELVPQPSDDPEDPLNWPTWKKDLNLASLLVMVGLSNSMKTALLPTGAVLASHFKVAYATISLLTAAPLILAVLTGFLSAILARLCGKRPLYLVGTALTLIGCIWNVTVTNSFASCLGARLFQGLGWGIFDTLVLSSLQDTYFEHQRDLRVTLYNVLCITTTWGSPLISGAISTSSFTTPFYAIAIFYLVAVPLIVLAAPETAFDRASAATAPTPVSGFTLSRKWQPWRLKHRFTKERLIEYFKGLKPCTFTGSTSTTSIMQIPRTMVAPTALLSVALTMLPAGSLWGLAMSLSLLLGAPPLSHVPGQIGTVMVGPWLLPMVAVAAISFYRGVHAKFATVANVLIIMSGTALAMVGILTFCLGIYNFLTPSKSAGGQQVFFSTTSSLVSVPLLSFQLAVLAAAFAVLDTATRPLLARSASFTSSSMAVAVRSIGDMHMAVILLRNLITAVFIIVTPYIICAFPDTGIKALAIGLSVAQVCIALLIVLLQGFFDEAIWRADGKVMGLVDLSNLKQSASFFDMD